MWEAVTESSYVRSVVTTFIIRDGARLAFSKVLESWENDASFRTFFTSLIADAPFAAFRWETPPLTGATVDREFECVFIECPALGRSADPAAFAEYFSDDDVVSFPNLGRDAVLVVPCPRGEPQVYGHLAAFVRGAPEEQRHSLWVEVARALRRRLDERPVWLSTAGMGAPWLHVRLDNRPKYYAYEPYREAP